MIVVVVNYVSQWMKMCEYLIFQNITGSKTPMRTTRSLANQLPIANVKGVAAATVNKTSENSVDGNANRPLSVTNSPSRSSSRLASPAPANSHSESSRHSSPMSGHRLEKTSAKQQQPSMKDFSEDIDAVMAALDSTQSDEDIALACDKIEQEQVKVELINTEPTFERYSCSTVRFNECSVWIAVELNTWLCCWTDKHGGWND